MKRTILSLFVLLSVCLCACTQEGDSTQVTTQEAAYPVAEWDKATAILMHTPGQELFDGVIHPSAGLFENYFDVDKAAAEHRGYIEALENNGIKVYTVEQLLNEAPIEKLREHAMNVLTYDISNIPNADAEENNDYRLQVIGEMSRADLIRCILLQPTVTLYPTENNTGVEAVYTHQSMTIKHSRNFDTPVGIFEYDYISRTAFAVGVRSIHKGDYAFLMASPEKALCDLIANSSKVNLRYMKDVEIYLEQDIRMDMDQFYKMDTSIFEDYIKVGKKADSISTLLKFLRR